MRKLFLFFLLFPAFSFAQDTTHVGCKINREINSFSKEEKLSTGFLKLNGGMVSFDATAAEITVLFSLEGREVCFDNNSTAYVYFEGTKSKLTIRNNGTMNCEGLFQFVFKNTQVPNTNMTRLSTQKVDKIVFKTTSEKELTVNVLTEKRDTMMQMANCLVNEAKTLIRE